MPKLLYKFMSVLQVTSVRRALGLTPLQGAFDPVMHLPSCTQSHTGEQHNYFRVSQHIHIHTKIRMCSQKHKCKALQALLKTIMIRCSLFFLSL